MNDPTAQLGVQHGDVVLEYHHRHEPRSVYLMTDRGFVLRSIDGGPPLGYYGVNPESLPEQIASVRESDVFVVTRDLWDGPAVTLARPSLVAEAGRGDTDRPPELAAAPAAAPAVVGGGGDQSAEGDDVPEQEQKALRWGARANRAIDSELGLNKTEQKKARDAAEGLARSRTLPNGKPDTMVRLWDAYEGAGKEMPDGLADEKAYFLENGKMKRTSGGGGGNSGGGTAEPPSDPPSSPEPSPSGDQTL